ncbi:MAG TPA: hypothetical protein DDX39_06685 [Bacteroidales bacterium]|nr:MAG: hypothetical protein A2W98_11275 [Bacteroidetes bacterium GWF2_33_38]OFY70570.1 MAG: hypothetical protein A2265_11275 [Bacteroidetes bacterium RIFOXYA12_FULL_33_9]OFY86762.1 MAG: hypothetical protein A2236_10415 [Bacteroidetes bacterium RIFOXYA2_FULL_33_7]HBF88313.1 hypothetical protein [Bacteroidales bacterium]
MKQIKKIFLFIIVAFFITSTGCDRFVDGIGLSSTKNKLSGDWMVWDLKINNEESIYLYNDKCNSARLVMVGENSHDCWLEGYINGTSIYFYIDGHFYFEKDVLTLDFDSLGFGNFCNYEYNDTIFEGLGPYLSQASTCESCTFPNTFKNRVPKLGI